MNKSIIAYLPDLAVPWAIEKRTGRYLYWMLNRYVAAGSDLQAVYPELAERYEPGSDPYTEIRDDVAVFTVDGVLLKHPPPSGHEGPVAPTYAEIENALTHLAARGDINTIILKLSSFGGTSSGLVSCMDRIRDITQEKRVIGFISDYACSAGYALVSQCSEVIASEGAYVGSIGAFIVLIDDTQALEDMGLKLTVVSTGEYKGLGADGAVSDKLTEEAQRTCDEIMVAVGGRIQSARGLSDAQMEAVSTGQVWQPIEAQQLGLIDSIQNFTNLGGSLMSDKTLETQLQESNEAVAQMQSRLDEMQGKLDEAQNENASLRASEEARTAEYRTKQCQLYVTSLTEKGLLQPKVAPLLTSFLGLLAEVQEPVSLNVADDNNNVTTSTKPLVEHAQHILETALKSAAPNAGEQFTEMGHVTAQQQANADANTVVENLKKAGVKMQKKARLSAPNPESSNKNGIQHMTE